MSFSLFSSASSLLLLCVALHAMNKDSVGPCDIRVLPLGAGQDVGGSCIVVTFGGRTVMFDCGMHMTRSAADGGHFPDFRKIAPSGPYTRHIDCVIISHLFVTCFASVSNHCSHN